MKDFPVRVYAANVDQLEQEEVFRAAYEKATEERRQKVDRMGSVKGRCLSLGVELLLLYGLSELGLADLTADRIRYRYGEDGKPYLEGAEDVYFNLSHSGDMVLCAIAPREVGCDVEKIRKRELAVARRFFTVQEYEKIASLEDEAARREMFCRYWTLKESFLKVTGQGIRLGLNNFQIILENEISVIQNVDRRTYCFREYDAAKGYCCAVCAVQSEFETEVRQVNILKNILEMLK